MKYLLLLGLVGLIGCSTRKEDTKLWAECFCKDHGGIQYIVYHSYATEIGCADDSKVKAIWSMEYGSCGLLEVP